MIVLLLMNRGLQFCQLGVATGEVVRDIDPWLYRDDHAGSQYSVPVDIHCVVGVHAKIVTNMVGIKAVHCLPMGERFVTCECASNILWSNKLVSLASDWLLNWQSCYSSCVCGIWYFLNLWQFCCDIILVLLGAFAFQTACQREHQSLKQRVNQNVITNS